MKLTLAEAYITLEIDKSADEATVRTAYKRQALLTHPDKNPGDPDAKVTVWRPFLFVALFLS
jgi:molecular chaperone DnaJ